MANPGDEAKAPRAKVSRFSPASFDSLIPPSSQPLFALSSSLPDHQDISLRLPFPLSEIAFTNSHQLRSRNVQDIGNIEVTASIKARRNTPPELNLTPHMSPPDSEDSDAPVQIGGQEDHLPHLPVVSYTGVGSVNLVDAHTGKIIATRDPRGGFGYDPELNFTPVSSFASDASVETVVSRNLFPLDPGRRQLNAVSLFGLPQDRKNNNFDDGSSKTIVNITNGLVNIDNLASFKHYPFVVCDVIEPNSSFDDMLVCRCQGDTSFTSPSTKRCSAAANMVDITKANMSASALLGERDDSEHICETLMSRLECMMNMKVANAMKEAKTEQVKMVVPKPVDAAVQLLKYLLEQKEMHVETGVNKETIELELRWAEWLVEVTKSGVMHLKIPGCTCRPELLSGENEERQWDKQWD